MKKALHKYAVMKQVADQITNEVALRAWFELQNIVRKNTWGKLVQIIRNEKNENQQ